MVKELLKKHAVFLSALVVLGVAGAGIAWWRSSEEAEEITE